MNHFPAFWREWNLGENAYFLSGPASFFHRYCGNGFSTKWTGLWKEETKHLEYYAVKAGEEWLAESNTRQFFYDGATAIHQYQTSKGIVHETLVMHPKHDELIVLLEFPEKTVVRVEMAIDIRKRHENNTNRSHSWIQNDREIAIQNELGETNLYFFEGKPKMENAFQKSHAPGNEYQTCSVNNLVLEGKTIGFTVSCGKKPFTQTAAEARKAMALKPAHYHSISSELLESDNSKLERGLQWGRIGVELLKQKRNGNTVFCAGYPWFTQAWGRDTFWSLFGLVDLGLVEDAKRQLELFANFSKNGKIPNFLPSAFNSIDATLLWIITLQYTALNSGDKKWMHSQLPALERALGFLSRQTHPSGLLLHDLKEKETWMDTLERGQVAVEVQALYVRALECAQEYWKAVSPKPFGFEKELQKSKVALHEFFEKNPFPPDRILNADQKNADGLQTANPVIPIMFNQFDATVTQSILDRLESSDFSTLTGLRSRARGQPFFDPAGYHTGSVWSITTAWLCMAQFRQHRVQAAYRNLEALLLDLERNALGCVSESFHADSGKVQGCLLQLWGQAMLAHIIDSYLLGIEIDCVSKKISFRPQLPDQVSFAKRTKKIHGSRTVFVVERDSKTKKIVCRVQGLPTGFKVETKAFP